MGIRNYLIEGVSCAGKTSVATELQRRGYHVIHGDRELAYQGDPQTGEPLKASAQLQEGGHDVVFRHSHHIWNVDRVKSLLADHGQHLSFFCGGSRNFDRFIDLFDGVFVLDIDQETLTKRLADRPCDEFGARPDERALILRLHATKEDVPADATIIDATAPLARVVDDILCQCR
ncbi:AAA family ATPase [Agrobacterium sp. NPDC089420]|uniref:AAA family ATPase n=1 Tax=Agrobacterium sp. NPDC089420 TaxID=3363918 RepID=UPI00384E84A7